MSLNNDATEIDSAGYTAASYTYAALPYKLEALERCNSLEGCSAVECYDVSGSTVKKCKFYT